MTLEMRKGKTMTENVNGIQVDVSKYVGEEIARLAVASIDEDRLNRLAEKAIRDLYENNQWFEGQRTTTIHRMAAQLLGEKIQKHVADILERDDFKEQARRQAEQIVEDMQKRVREIVVEQYANALAGNIATGYFGGMFKMNVQQIVTEMLG